MSERDARPPVWIGHVVLGVPDVKAAAAFLEKLGMRPVEAGEGIAILELRGGTHVLVLRSDDPVSAGTPAPFDLMVDDVDACHRACARGGLDPSDVETQPYHRAFRVTEPNGHVFTVQSSHVEGPV